jgi:hypothetical protein
MQRRLAVTADGSQFLLVIDNCLQKDPSCINWDDRMPEACKAIPAALPIEAAVQLLNSDQSPEKELQRRRALAAEREAEEAARVRIASEKAHAEAVALNKARQERVDFRADAWEKIPPLQQALARLALAVAERDPKLAADVRAAADADASDFPRGKWWEGLPRFMEALRVADVLASIPEQTRVLLKLQHGPNPAAIVAGWEALQAQRKPKAA